MIRPFLCLFLLAALPTAAQSLYPGQCTGRFARETSVPLRAESFDLHDVRLLPSRFRDNMRRDSAWLASLSVDRLLHSFRTHAGVPAGREGGYMTVRKLGGWESLDCELRGHTTGHVLSACALMYAATGEEFFKIKGDSLVDGLAEVQRALGSGYLSAFPERLIDRCMAGQSVWAPWYTLHKLLAGLLDQYLLAGNAQALAAARGMASWAAGKLQPLDEEARRRMLRNEFGGISETFWNLYAITGDEHDRRLAEFFYHDDVLDPLRDGREEFGTKHTNTFIPKLLGEARNYEITGNDAARRAAEFFWHAVVSRHTFAPGCCSDKEHFFDPEHLSEHLSGYTGESCCTYNMLKLSRHLFCWTAAPEVADYYERALCNHILGQQDPESGMVCYFLPLASGSHKVYSTPEQSFWCCVGSGFESHAKYGEAIYYHHADTLYVNLLIPSQLTWRDRGISLTLRSRFPADGTAALEFECRKPVRATIRLRRPTWSPDPEIRIDGIRQHVRHGADGYIDLCRIWHSGDRIEIDYPMTLRFEPTPDDPRRGALFFGPILLAGRMGTEGFVAPQPDSDPAAYNDYYTYDYRIPGTPNDSLLFDPAQIRRSEGTLRFTLPDGRELAPLYDLHRERYTVYWNLK